MQKRLIGPQYGEVEVVTNKIPVALLSDPPYRRRGQQQGSISPYGRSHVQNEAWTMTDRTRFDHVLACSPRWPREDIKLSSGFKFESLRPSSTCNRITSSTLNGSIICLQFCSTGLTFLCYLCGLCGFSRFGDVPRVYSLHWATLSNKAIVAL